MNIVRAIRIMAALGLSGSVVSSMSAAETATHAQTLDKDTEVFAKADDGSPLTWKVYMPPGGGKHPAVLVIHGGGFTRAVNSPNAHAAAKAISEAGFVAFEVTYRLAPPGQISGQTSSGRFPDQTNDVRRAVLAARVDPRGNGQVGGVGGSAGAYHVAFAALHGKPGEDGLEVGVCLSGPYDLGDPASLEANAQYKKKVMNYAGSSPEELRRASPITYVTSSAPPLFLIQSQHEAMPFRQLPNLTAALYSSGVTTMQQQLLLPGGRHSWSFWPDIQERAIRFLRDGFARKKEQPGGEEDAEVARDVGRKRRSRR